MTCQPSNSHIVEKWGQELHCPKDWSKRWSLSFPVLESKVYILGQSPKDTKTLTLGWPSWRSPCCKGHIAEMLPLYFIGCWCHLGKMPVKPVTPRALRETGSKTKAFLNFEECLQTRWMPECVLACQLENKSSTWPPAQKADSPVRHLLSFEQTPSLALWGHKVLSGC